MTRKSNGRRAENRATDKGAAGMRQAQRNKMRLLRLVAAGAQALALPIDPAWQAGVRSICSCCSYTRRSSMRFRCLTKPSRRRCSVLETAAPDFAWSTAAEIVAAVGGGRASAVSIVEAALARIRERDPVLNSFTAVTEQRALARAQAIDASRARGEPLPALAGCRSR